MQDIALSTVDLAIVAGYFLLVFAIGFRMARRTHSAEDLFLAGRRLGWLPLQDSTRQPAGWPRWSIPMFYRR